MMRYCFVFKILILFFLLISSYKLYSQDSHYWTQHFGTQSTLLAGTVIGSFQDMSAVYYNPGAIAQMENPAFLLSARAFDLTWILFDKGAGEKYDLDYLRLKPSPDILAGIIPTNWEKNHRLAYFILTRHYFRMKSVNRIDATQNIFRDTPDNDRYSSETSIYINLREDWFGLTWSYKYNKPVSIGVSHFFAYRSHDMRTQITAQAISPDNRMANTTKINDFDYYNVRMLWKGGIAVNLSPLTMGLTVTTPSISIFGNGSIFLNESTNGLTESQNSTPIVIYDVNTQSDLPSRYRTAWSIGLGTSYRINRSTLHMSMEWYEGIPAYKILDAQPYIPATKNEFKELDFIQVRNPVMNIGLGYEYKLSENVNAYGGVTTDFSALPENSSDNSSIAHWDIYHISTGVLLQYKKFMLNLGIGYAFGNGYKEQLTNYETANEDNLLLGELTQQKIYYNKFKIVLGFSFHFFSSNQSDVD